MVADQQFPVNKGTVLTLSCEDGYRLVGGKTVTCTKDTVFEYSTEPQCGDYLAQFFKSYDVSVLEILQSNDFQ